MPAAPVSRARHLIYSKTGNSPAAETGTGEVCERAGEKMDELGKLLPHGKVIKQHTDGYLKQVNGYSWFKVRERS